MDAHAADRRFLTRSLSEAVQVSHECLDQGPRRRMGAGAKLVDHGKAVMAVIEGIGQQAQTDFDDATEALSRVPRSGEDPADQISLDNERITALNKLRKVVNLARYLRFSLSSLDAPSGELGLGAAYLLQDAAAVLVAPDVDLIETPVDGPQYATVSWPFEAVLSRSSVPERAVRGSRPIMVWFPRSESGNVLLLPLLVHELGHPCWDEHGLSERLWTDLIASDWRACFEGVVTPPHGPPRNRDSSELDLRTRLEEHFCDALACAILGPSYLFAFTGWVGAISLNSTPTKHPPTLLRIELMLAQLRSWGWGAQLERVADVCEWLDGMVDTGTPIAGMASEILDALREANDRVVNLAADRAGELLFTPQLYADERDVIEELLAAQILPAQLDHDGRPADRRAIFLAGWLDQMDGAQPEHLAQVLTDRQLHDFLDKALEMSAILDRWGTA